MTDSSENDQNLCNKNLSENNVNSTTIDSFRQKFLLNGKELLFMAFEESLNITRQQLEINKSNYDSIKISVVDSLNAYQLYERLNNITSVLIPFNEIVLQILAKLLESRISVANRCVTKMYKDEYQILFHFQNLRKVFLLEASDTMFYFYTNLFKQVSFIILQFNIRIIKSIICLD